MGMSCSQILLMEKAAEKKLVFLPMQFVLLSREIDLVLSKVIKVPVDPFTKLKDSSTICHASKAD